MGLEDERREYQSQLELVQSQLRDDPDNAELAALVAELQQMLDLMDESLAESAAAPQAPTPAASTAAPSAGAATETVKPYVVNDTVMARWTSGDKGFYTARIISITGAASDPMYTVKFKGYDVTESLRQRDLRPISTKRKAEASPPPPTARKPSDAKPESKAPAPSSSSAPPPPAEDRPKKAKKIKANRELESSKSKWQEFSAKGKGRPKKDSMFRTPDGIKGRVGFTGSGREMTKEVSRSRHVYEKGADDD